jgi:hypothetical protein
LESFVWGAAFVAFAFAAIATAKARATGEKRAHDEKSLSLFYQRREDEESAVSFAGDAGDARRRLTRDDEKESSTESTRQRESETTLRATRVRDGPPGSDFGRVAGVQSRSRTRR